MLHLDVEIAHRLIRGKLAPAEAAALEAHLDGCEACRRLVADERSWSNLLQLEARDAVPSGASRERLLPRLEALIPGELQRRQRVRVLLGLACGACIAAAFCAVLWRVTTPTAAQRLAAELEISEAQQGGVVAQLDALLALRDDPWLADEFATVDAFDGLLGAEREAGP